MGWESASGGCAPRCRPGVRLAGVVDEACKDALSLGVLLVGGAGLVRGHLSFFIDERARPPAPA